MPMPTLQKASAQSRVSYFYDHDVGNYSYGPAHPMKPHRMRMTHNLIVNYGLYKKLDIVRPLPATTLDMTKFHTDEYIDFLYRVTPDNMDQQQVQQLRFNVGEDCPIFEGLYEFCALSAGGSMGAAQKINTGESDIAINWSGGLHHAKRREASGFCYVNDIVLSILELLRYHQRVLYIDIDVHHGDGVEEAFYTTDRVMTCSFHKYGEYFPGTGDLKDVGIGGGKKYAVNVPLQDGIDDESYKDLFEFIVSNIMKYYRPSAVVLQCGADSLAGDKLGCFNLSMKGHANCVRFVKSYNLPMIVLGGGGYTIRNVARTWTYETGILVNEELSADLPFNDYFEYYGPEYKLEVAPNNMENHNSKEYLQRIKEKVVENLRDLPHAPSVQMQSVPRDWHPLGLKSRKLRGNGLGYDDPTSTDEELEDESLLNEDMPQYYGHTHTLLPNHGHNTRSTDARLSERHKDARITENEISDVDSDIGQGQILVGGGGSQGRKRSQVGIGNTFGGNGKTNGHVNGISNGSSNALQSKKKTRTGGNGIKMDRQESASSKKSTTSVVTTKSKSKKSERNNTGRGIGSPNQKPFLLQQGPPPQLQQQLQQQQQQQQQLQLQLQLQQTTSPQQQSQGSNSLSYPIHSTPINFPNVSYHPPPPPQPGSLGVMPMYQPYPPHAAHPNQPMAGHGYAQPPPPPPYATSTSGPQGGSSSSSLGRSGMYMPYEEGYGGGNAPLPYGYNR